MSKEGYNIEDFFRKGFVDYSKAPDSDVLKKIKRKLFWEDYFSLRYYKFNVGYTSIIIAGLILLLSNNSNKDASINLTENNEVSENNTVTHAKNTELTVREENTLSESIEPSDANISIAAVAGFSSSTKAGCAPLTIKFDNNSTNADTYFWNFGDGKSITTKNPEYTFENPGEYLVTLTAKNNLGSSIQTSKIVVHNKPFANIDIDIEKSSLEDKTVAFINNSQHASKHKWSFGDGTEVISKNASHKYKKAGTYKVTVIAINDFGCSDTATLENKFISKEYLLSFPSTFRPNPINRDNNGYYTSAKNEQFVFYPNNNGAKEYSFEVFSSNGLQLFKTNDIKQGWNGYIKGRLAPAGEYIYRAKGIYPNGKAFNYSGTFSVIADNYNDYY